jgi:diacylglycerol kinase family enzyme
VAATRVLIVANPAAGAVTPALVWEAVLLCRRLGCRVSVRWTTGPGEATRIARKAAESVAPTVTERALAFSPVGLRPPVSSVRQGTDSSGAVIVVVGGDGTVDEVTAGLESAWSGAAPTRLLIVPGGTVNSRYRDRFGSTPWQSAVEDVAGSPARAA